MCFSRDAYCKAPGTRVYSPEAVFHSSYWSLFCGRGLGLSMRQQLPQQHTGSVANTIMAAVATDGGLFSTR